MVRESLISGSFSVARFAEKPAKRSKAETAASQAEHGKDHPDQSPRKSSKNVASTLLGFGEGRCLMAVGIHREKVQGTGRLVVRIVQKASRAFRTMISSLCTKKCDACDACGSIQALRSRKQPAAGNLHPAPKQLALAVVAATQRVEPVEEAALRMYLRRDPSRMDPSHSTTAHA